jgi:NTP pyrophosphatase (non-canonical NTP hydrolase)
MSADRMSQLTEEVLAFAAARNWEQFHSPKNLAMALSGEVGELVEHFQWLTEMNPVVSRRRSCRPWEKR